MKHEWEEDTTVDREVGVVHVVCRMCGDQTTVFYGSAPSPYSCPGQVKGELLNRTHTRDNF